MSESNEAFSHRNGQRIARGPLITVSRYHDFSAGHRVVGHENKCRSLHGHNYRVTFHVTAPALDTLGRVLDFSFLKSSLCQWLEDNWDHKMLLWEKDPIGPYLQDLRRDASQHSSFFTLPVANELLNGLDLVEVPFNPTAEHMAQYLLHVVGPLTLKGTGARLVGVDVSETRKCSASAQWQEV